MNPRHLLRMAKWAKHPPSEKRVKFFFAIVLICVAIYAVERWIGWPDWMTLETRPARTPRF